MGNPKPRYPRLNTACALCPPVDPKIYSIFDGVIDCDAHGIVPVTPLTAIEAAREALHR